MVLLRSLAALLALGLQPAHAQSPAPAAPPPSDAATATESPSPQARAALREAQRAEHMRQLTARADQQRRNAAGEIRTLRDPLWDGYVLEFEHSLLFEDVREQAGFRVREYELALRLVQPRVALAALMERLLDSGFTVEEPIGPPQARVLRFWRQGRSVQDARFSVHVGERALSAKPSPVELGATGVLILRLYERRAE
ncbi:MAG: hypothetical protein H4O13_12535 [Xanthomonadales bacterium]|nr:hypothetical protein [Xanthomonadales bacterium]